MKKKTDERHFHSSSSGIINHPEEEEEEEEEEEKMMMIKKKEHEKKESFLTQSVESEGPSYIYPYKSYVSTVFIAYIHKQCCCVLFGKSGKQWSRDAIYRENTLTFFW